MSTYKCVVSDLKGRKIEILRDAPSEDLLIASFLSGDLFLIKYAEADKKEKLKKRFSTKVLIDFTDIMASLLDAKLSVQDSLQMIMSIEDNVSVRKLASELYAGLLHGEHLYNVMALFPSTFSFPSIAQTKKQQKADFLNALYKTLKGLTKIHVFRPKSIRANFAAL